MICKYSFPVACLLLCASLNAGAGDGRQPLVLLSDFGETERFVASMKGVALSVDPRLQVHDLSHNVEPFNIWQASYLLSGTIEFWPRGTVFVSVVDPGVGTTRKSVVLETASGHYVVSPDNGSLTLVADALGVGALREIDETVNRRPGSQDSHTFHGRDVYAYTGARLAAGVIDFSAVGPLLKPRVIRLEYQQPKKIDSNSVVGNITHIEKPFGNVVTNLSRALFDELGVRSKDKPHVQVTITRAGDTVFQRSLPFVPSFGFVDHGSPLLYSDSSQQMGLAINSGDFARQYGVQAGADWTIQLTTSTATTHP